MPLRHWRPARPGAHAATDPATGADCVLLDMEDTRTHALTCIPLSIERAERLIADLAHAIQSAKRTARSRRGPVE